MKYMFLGLIGIAIMLFLIVLLCVKTLSGKRKNKLQSALNLILAALLLACVFTSALALSYDYFFLKGANLIEGRKYLEATKSLQSALFIRKMALPFIKVFNFEKINLPFATEVDVRMKLGCAYEGLKDYQHAISEYQALLYKDKNNFDATAEIADIHFLTRDFKTAISYYQRLIEIEVKEKDCNYYYKKGRAYIILFDYENAINHLQKSLELGKDITTVKPYLDLCYRKIKDK